ncbi:MAG TPA: GlxA family transcriptional regulator [Conexibacter sp.]|jgi:transcriptional regulator GlxA family with amidase domain
MEAHRVLIVLFDGVQSLDVTGPLEVFAGAATHPACQPRYAVSTASLGGALVRTTSGLQLVPDAALEHARTPDTVIVPGGNGAHAGDPRLIAWLQRRAPRCGRVVSVCTGAYLLADAGLLDGRRATTHWARCNELARRHPQVEVDPDPIWLRDGDVYTSAGVTSGIDLALALVEQDVGRDVALAVARHLVVFLRRPGGQAQFSAQLAAQVAERQPLRELQQWIADHPGDDLSVESLAARAHLSPRQFARAFAAEVGVTPGRYVDQVRLETARRRLEEGSDGVEAVARTCGYGTAESMRRAFVRALGVAPAEYRRRFQAMPA